MKIIRNRISLLSMLLIVALTFVPFGAYASENCLNKADDFFFSFNFFAAYLNTGHSLSDDNVDEVSRLSDGILYKTIFNKCEILSLILSSDAKEVQTIQCTWAMEMPSAQTYLEDFLNLLMEAILACGLEEDTAKEVFTFLGSRHSFDIGDSGEMTVDNINISYKVERGIGVSFKIEKE